MGDKSSIWKELLFDKFFGNIILIVIDDVFFIYLLRDEVFYFF